MADSLPPSSSNWASCLVRAHIPNTVSGECKVWSRRKRWEAITNKRQVNQDCYGRFTATIVKQLGELPRSCSHSEHCHLSFSSVSYSSWILMCRHSLPSFASWSVGHPQALAQRVLQQRSRRRLQRTRAQMSSQVAKQQCSNAAMQPISHVLGTGRRRRVRLGLNSALYAREKTGRVVWPESLRQATRAATPVAA